MKKLLAIILLGVSYPALAKGAIPPQFHGIWGGDAKICKEWKKLKAVGGDPLGFPDTGMEIGRDGFSMYESGCGIKKIIKKSDLSITAKFLCNDGDGPDESTKSIKVLTLSDNGKKLTTKEEDGSTYSQVRCE